MTVSYTHLAAFIAFAFADEDAVDIVPFAAFQPGSASKLQVEVDFAGRG